MVSKRVVHITLAGQAPDGPPVRPHMYTTHTHTHAHTHTHTHTPQRHAATPTHLVDQLCVLQHHVGKAGALRGDALQVFQAELGVRLGHDHWLALGHVLQRVPVHVWPLPLGSSGVRVRAAGRAHTTRQAHAASQAARGAACSTGCVHSTLAERLTWPM
jgi:hypothetical protein